MEARTFWTRVGDWFRPMTRGTLTDHLSRTDRDGLTKRSPDTNGGNGSSRFMPLSRRPHKEQVQQLEQGYQKLTGLVDSIHRHLEAQDERSRQVTEALSQVASTVARLPAAAEGQREQLAAVAEQLEHTNRRLAGCENALAPVPKLVDAQREALDSLTGQFEASSRTNARVAESVAGFSDAVGSVQRAYGTSVETLKELQRSLGDREERMTDLLVAQNRRFGRLLLGAAGLAAVAWIAVAVIPLLT